MFYLWQRNTSPGSRVRGPWIATFAASPPTWRGPPRCSSSRFSWSSSSSRRCWRQAGSDPQVRSLV